MMWFRAKKWCNLGINCTNLSQSDYRDHQRFQNGFNKVFYVTNGSNKLRQLSTLLDENLTCEFKRENSFTLSKSCMKTEQFLFTVESSLYPQLNWRTWPQSKGKSRCGYDAAFLPNVFRVVVKLCARNYWTWYKLLWTKYRETKLKSTKKRNFIALKDIFLTTPGCCLT